MKLDNKEKFAFITMGVAALNSALMASGIETMPGMWIKEVYQDHMLGASLGFITGVGLGGMTGAAYISTQETAKAGIKAIKNICSKAKKLDNKEKFAFITMGVTALNMGLMASGIETMPGMWVQEVYQDHMLGASIGGMTGVGLGGMIGAAYIASQETVKAGIKAIRNGLNQPATVNKISI